MSGWCFYCQGTYSKEGEKFCDRCRQELSTNRQGYLERLIAEAKEEMANFEVFSRGAGKYRISKGRALGDEYATKRFGELVRTMEERIKAISQELQEGTK